MRPDAPLGMACGIKVCWSHPKQDYSPMVCGHTIQCETIMLVRQVQACAGCHSCVAYHIWRYQGDLNGNSAAIPKQACGQRSRNVPATKTIYSPIVTPNAPYTDSPPQLLRAHLYYHQNSPPISTPSTKTTSLPSSLATDRGGFLPLFHPRRLSSLLLTSSALSLALRLASWTSRRFSIGGVRGRVAAVRQEAFAAASDASHLGYNE